MSSSESNSLMSSQKGSDLHVVLHPLVLLNISDYITRHTLRQQGGPILGAMLGKHDGREITVEHAYECLAVKVPDVEGGFQLHSGAFSDRLEEMKTVHKDRQLDLVGWYTLLPPNGPTLNILPIHNQVLEGYNESAILLGFHPSTCLTEASSSGVLPITIYESNYEVDEAQTSPEDEDRKMEDGEATLKLKFREVGYSVETDETEMISMNYVAGSGGNASAAQNMEEKPSLSLTSDGKGKRRLVESEDSERLDQPDDAVLFREEEELISSLTTKQNAISMLRSRIQLLIQYLRHIESKSEPKDAAATDGASPAGSPTASNAILRKIQALIGRMDLVIPSDEKLFEEQYLHETNDVKAVDLLNDVLQSLKEARSAGKKFGIIESAKISARRGPDFYNVGGDTVAGTSDMLD